MKRLKKGFTLIELLVVIAIIGILATTLAPKLREQLAKAKDSKAVALLGAARTAAGTLLVDKMVQDVTTDITFTELKDRLDSKAVAVFTTSSSALVTVGGSRTAADASVVYGNAVVLSSSGSAVSGGIPVGGDEVGLYLDGENTATAEKFSTEGKEWATY